MATADPNWLYSTAALSSAAVVAIVGGLITSHVLSFSARRKALDEQVRELEVKYVTLQDNLETARQEIERYTLAEYERRSIQTIVRLPSLPLSPSEARSVFGDAGVSNDAYRHWWTGLRFEIESGRRLVSEISLLIPEFGGAPFSLWRRACPEGLSFSKEWLLRHVFYGCRDMEAHSVNSASRTPGLSYSFEKVAAASGEQETQFVVEGDSGSDDELERLHRKVDTTEVLVKKCDEDLIELRRIRNQFSESPTTLWVGWAVLIFLTAVGIILPLTKMPQASSDYETRDKTLVISGFIFGISLVFIYIAWLMAPRSFSRISPWIRYIFVRKRKAVAAATLESESVDFTTLG